MEKGVLSIRGDGPWSLRQIPVYYPLNGMSQLHYITSTEEPRLNTFNTAFDASRHGTENANAALAYFVCGPTIGQSDRRIGSPPPGHSTNVMQNI